MRNFVRKNMHLSCRPSIQASKRRQALMNVNSLTSTPAQDEADLAFNPSFSPRSSDVTLYSDDEVWESDNTNNDIGVSSIDIGGED